MDARFYKYFIYGYSQDHNLFTFLRVMSKREGYSENLLNVEVIQSAHPLSLESFLRAVDFMNDYLNLSFICSLILQYAEIIKKQISYEKYGVIVKENFTKQNMSLEHRIDVLMSMIKKEWKNYE